MNSNVYLAKNFRQNDDRSRLVKNGNFFKEKIKNEFLFLKPKLPVDTV